MGFSRALNMLFSPFYCGECGEHLHTISHYLEAHEFVFLECPNKISKTDDHYSKFIQRKKVPNKYNPRNGKRIK